MDYLALHAHYFEQNRGAESDAFYYLFILIEYAINTEFHSKEHLSNWLDETIEEQFEVSEIEQFGRQQFDDEVCKIATVIASELGLQ